MFSQSWVGAVRARKGAGRGLGRITLRTSPKRMRLLGDRRGATRMAVGGLCLLVASLGTAAWRRASAPRVWRPCEPPVAFWAWRAEAPSPEDVAHAVRETGAQALFIRAGQFDLADGKPRRIRAVAGKMPRSVELHLVYNGTREFLAEFERVDEKILAASVAEVFRSDQERAGKDGATVRGLQLDFDSPTRLLARYARILRALREQLPPDVKLSVTGLPTWMGAAALREVLAETDFWAPQFYGGEIPEKFDRAAPISSPPSVARDVARARALGEPFYAGLAAYGYALLYTERGELAAISGDLDPARVAASQDFELVERRAFERRVANDNAGSAARESEWRYIYRASADTKAGGLSVRACERLVFDLPSSESLRASVRGVREQAGEKLLGILLFRLPTSGDPTTLNIRQIAAALEDREAEVKFDLSVARSSRGVEGAGDDGARAPANHLSLRATNRGAAGAALGGDALTLDIGVSRGVVRGVVSLEGFDSVETLCTDASVRDAAPQPCGMRRANLLRLRASSWGVDAFARVTISFEGEPPHALATRVAVRADDGRTIERIQTIRVGESGGR